MVIFENNNSQALCLLTLFAKALLEKNVRWGSKWPPLIGLISHNKNSLDIYIQGLNSVCKLPTCQTDKELLSAHLYNSSDDHSSAVQINLLRHG